VLGSWIGCQKISDIEVSQEKGEVEEPPETAALPLLRAIASALGVKEALLTRGERKDREEDESGAVLFNSKVTAADLLCDDTGRRALCATGVKFSKRVEGRR